MNLISFQGFHCYLGSVANLAAEKHIPYQNAFLRLWTETDFFYDREYQLFLSQRLFPDLAAWGADVKKLSCAGTAQRQESIRLLQNHERFLVGMDSYFIPWCPIYQHFHSPHYFIAQKTEGGFFPCHDCIYEKSEIPMAEENIYTNAFEISRMLFSEPNPPKTDLYQEALAVRESHPPLLTSLCAQIQACGAARESWQLLLRYLNTLVSHRRLFACFLHHSDPAFLQSDFFSEAFLRQWEAAENGVRKASVLKEPAQTIQEVCLLFETLLREEMEMAEKICAAR